MKETLKKYDKYLTFRLGLKLYRFFKDEKKENIEENIRKNYLERLGITNIEEQKEIIKNAYERANHNRDFEIDKFWSRAAYFWTFQAIIFAVYFTYLTTEFGDNKKSSLEELIRNYKYIELYIVCLGLIFSFAWRYVILGSKQWQENWESHIDHLEQYVTGHLYANIFKKNKFYSVSKINLILSNVFICVWIVIIFSYLNRINALNLSTEINYDIFWPVTFTTYIIAQFMFGYGRTDIDKSRFIE
ncbi:hypothetical protein D3C80_853230 [compost metagenome]